ESFATPTPLPSDAPVSTAAVSSSSRRVHRVSMRCSSVRIRAARSAAIIRSVARRKSGCAVNHDEPNFTMRRDYLAGLTAFAAVAEKKSFTAAAAQLGISSSAVSHAVRDLEARLGLRLLNRSTRSVNLTEAGERYFARVMP